MSDRKPAVAERWIPPGDLDPEVLSLCQAMNAFPGIFTTESCCGHGRQPFRIWFMAESLEALPPRDGYESAEVIARYMREASGRPSNA